MDLKIPYSFDEQMQSLIDKNITVNDPKYRIDFLNKVNYYKLSAYFLPFKKSDGKCHPNVSFERICQIYMFDKELRTLILKKVEDIELHLRTQIAYYHSHKYGPLGYFTSSTHNSKHNHAEFEKRIHSTDSV